MVFVRQRFYIAIIMFTIITVAGVSPAFSSPEVRFADTAIRVEGQNTIRVPVLISGFEGAGIKGFVLRINYDDTILKNGRCDNFETKSPPLEGPGDLSVALMSRLSIPADGTLLTLEFDHDAPLPDTLSFSFASPDDRTVLFKEGFVKVEAIYTNNPEVKVPPPPCSATCSVQTKIIGGEGTISPSGKRNFSCGDTQRYSFTPDACFKVRKVSLVDENSGYCKYSGSRSPYPFKCEQEDDGKDYILKVLFEREKKTLNIETIGSGEVYAILPDGEKKLGTSEKFPCGLPQTLKLVPSDHYELGEVLIDGAPPAVSEENTIPYTPNDDDQPHTLHVEFVQKQTTVHLTVVGNGAVSSPPGSADPIDLSEPFVIPPGQDGNFGFVPAPCYAIGDVVADGVSLGAVSEHVIPNDGKSHSLSITFAQKLVTLRITTEGKGALFDTSDMETPLGDAKEFPCGESQTLKLAPASCYEVSEVSLSGTALDVSTDNTITVPLEESDAEPHLHVVFSQKQITLRITTEGEGVLFDISNTETPLRDTKEFPCGESQTITLAPASCYEISEASLNDTPLNVSADNTITVPLEEKDAAPHLHVKFVRKQITIDITKDGEGDISDISPDTEATALGETGTFVCGLSRTIELLPAPFYKVGEVLLGDEPLDVSPNNTVIFTLTDKDEPPTLNVTFDRKQIPLNITIEGGSGSVYALPDETTPLNLSLPIKLYCGLSQSFKIIPDECYQIEEVRVNGNITELLPDDTLKHIPGDGPEDQEDTLEIRLVRKKFTISASVVGNAAIYPSGDYIVTCGTSVRYTIQHLYCDTRETLEDVWVDGVSVRSELTRTEDSAVVYEFDPVKKDHTIEARFSDTCSASARNGEILVDGRTCTLVPNPCYEIGVVKIGDVTITDRVVIEGGIGHFELEEGENSADIRVGFMRKSYPATAVAETGGIISPSGGSLLYCGTDYVYTIMPDNGYVLGDVLVNGDSVRSFLTTDPENGAYLYTFNCTGGEYRIEAGFSPKAYRFDVTASEGGNVDPSDSVSAAFGSSRTVTIEPADCYRIDDVLLDGNSVRDMLTFTGDVARFTLNQISADHTLEIFFALESYTVTVSAGQGGIITSDLSLTAVCGADRTFEVTPQSGWRIADVRVDGQSVMSDPVADGESFQFSLYQIHADHLIEAEFALVPSSEPENHSPEISGTPSDSVTVGVAYKIFTPEASDPDGDSFSFSIVNKPDWAEFDPETGTLSGTPSSEDVGKPAKDIVITVTDSQGLSAALPAFELIVKDAPNPSEDAPKSSGGGGGGGCFIQTISQPWG
ncbi:hypothetical protein DENIS_0301 [Desulfonema ishimotonii]|uniref:Dystroglycan-type cadherin-like domain-containing protein n=1 Tax=Desulfonema ishimotonii TaxID=45657 RepID=A0A401FQX2_9BACT|nr:putative Ig domain-containing protein [Desulfonema ishimotonii]GBC59362.1 hypothetical protein DENIS_0301 [Desulfonema ishimotonii]